MKTLGIDLAAKPERTGAAVVDWAAARGTVVRLEQPASNECIERLAAGADIVAIDAPLGWPRDFVGAVASHQTGQAWTTDPASEALRLRRTDREQGLSPRPLSVSTDRLGIVAFRAAYLLPRLGKGDTPARDGSDAVVEVYPAGALRRWQLPSRGYKRDAPDHRQTREVILGELRHRYLDHISEPERLIDSADLLDAVIAAIVGFELSRGGTDPIPNDAKDLALEEGWVHLPTGTDG